MTSWQSLKSTDNGKAFLLALSLLTRFPVPNIDNLQAQDSGRSALFYPLVGLIIGLVLSIPVLLFSDGPTFLVAAIVVTIWAMVTGALHLDGLADSADGWLGGMGDLEKTQRIMADPVVGTAGAVAIACLLILKVAAVSAVLTDGSIWLIILAPILGRGMILALLVTTPYNGEGMVKQTIETLPRKYAFLIIGVCSLIGLYFSFWGLLFVVIGFWLLRRLMQKLLKGFTGDTAGATVEISEMLWLAGSVLV